MKRPSRKFLIVLFVSVLLVSGSYILYRQYGPGWQYLTPPPEKWKSMVPPPGSAGEFSCEFDIEDPSGINDIFLHADDEKEADIYINGALVMHCNGFYYRASNRNKDIRIRPYFKQQPHVMDRKAVIKHIKKGRNKVAYRFIVEPGDEKRFRSWALIVDKSGWSMQKRRYGFPETTTWHRPSDFSTVRIDIPDLMIPDEGRAKGEVKIKMKDGTAFKSDIRIEARGRSTLHLMQKSFGFRLTGKDPKKQPNGIPGLGQGADWVLYAPSCDLSMIRNVITYDLFRDMGHYAVKYEPVELIINNRYRGIYYLMQRIQIGPDRLALRFDSLDAENPANSAFLVEIDQADSNDLVVHTWYSHFILQKIGKNIPPLPYEKNVASRLELMLRYVYQRDSTLPKIIDYTSFADYILLQEVSKNTDAYRLSTYFHKDHDSINPLIQLGPVWDFNLAYGLPGATEQDHYDGWIHERREAVDSFWTILFNRPDFRKVLVTRYRLFRNTMLSEKALHERITSAIDRLEPAIDNHRLWFGWPKKEYWPYKDVPVTPEDETKSLESFLRNRLAWMDKTLL
ncbi:MAG: CotH kinase family protein [Bacteroidota bacterium]